MYFTTQTDRKTKEPQMATRKGNMPASKPDWHRDMHIWNEGDPFNNVTIQTKREKFQGTGIIQREPNLTLGRYVKIGEASDTDIGQIVKITGYEVDVNGEKANYNESDVHTLPSHIEHIYSVLKNGILSPKAMHEAHLIPGATTTDQNAMNYHQKNTLHVVRFLKTDNVSISNDVLTNELYGAYIIALEDNKKQKYTFPTTKYCENKLIEKRILQNNDKADEEKMQLWADKNGLASSALKSANELRRKNEIIDLYLKNFSEELVSGIRGELEERLKNSMLVISKKNDTVDTSNQSDSLQNAEKRLSPDQQTQTAQELIVEDKIEPERFNLVLLPKGLNLEGLPETYKSNGKCVSVDIVEKKLVIPVNLLFEPNTDQNLNGRQMSVTLKVPDYNAKLPDKSGTYYSHLVRV